MRASKFGVVFRIGLRPELASASPVREVKWYRKRGLPPMRRNSACFEWPQRHNSLPANYGIPAAEMLSAAASLKFGIGRLGEVR